MAVITSLPPELIRAILFYLHNEDLFLVLKVCKYFNSIAVPYLWSQFSLGDPWPRNLTSNSPIGRLARLTKKNGPDTLGYKYISTLRIDNDKAFKQDGAYIKHGFIELLGDLVESGTVPLRILDVFHLTRYHLEGNDHALNFFKKIKKYSETKAPDEFDLKLRADPATILVDDIFDLSKLSKLYIPITLQNSISKKFARSHNLKWRRAREGATDENIIENIVALTKIMSITVHIRDLTITVSSMYYEPGPIHLLLEDLNKMQTAFTNLRRLHRLEIRAVGWDEPFAKVFFHPAFSLEPPESVRHLTLATAVSVFWWRKFAGYPFRNVESLNIDSPVIGIQSKKWMSVFNEEKEKGDVGDWNFIIKDVAVTTLKKFICPEMKDSYMPYPRDLHGCIYRKNRALDGLNLERMKKKVRREFGAHSHDYFSFLAQRLTEEMSDTYCETYFEDAGPANAEFLDCMEEMRLSNHELRIKLAQQLLEWTKKDVDGGGFLDYSKY
ncbi:hypothetical protein H072_8380 [Dactylellina haptotyla CBS 200.50]|uniref:F-box domain-containing protein n=1 Tax=Dactylellina haptotyla (strain CBS 200.50) TaxID=1284197 RepID=S8A4Z5_DACHA|nr:hypothetical protein H072_8380 [Dactylellina haptotyla CBS 200.50]